MLKPRLHDERGFTLIELLVGATVGTVVVLAAFGMVDAALRSSTNVTARADAAGRSRNAIDQMAQTLRSSVCIKQNPALSAISAGDDNSVTYYAPQPADAALSTFTPYEWKLTYAGNVLTESRWQPTSGSYPNLTYPLTSATPTLKRTLVVNVHQAPPVPPASTSPPLFTYYAYQPDGTIDPLNGTPLTTPLSATDLAKVAAIRIRFSVGGGVKPTPAAPTDSTLDEVITMRTVDPDSPQDGPVCRV